MKLPQWEDGGFVIWMKRLECGGFHIPQSADGRIELTGRELSAILSGIKPQRDYRRINRRRFNPFPLMNGRVRKENALSEIPAGLPREERIIDVPAASDFFGTNSGRTRYDASFVAKVVADKVENSIPLERQAGMFASEKLPVAPSGIIPEPSSGTRTSAMNR